jgi:hypothetical protein
MRQRVSHKIVISQLKKRVAGRGFVVLAGDPRADRAKGRQDRSIGLEKEARAALCRPRRQFISASFDLIANFLNAEDLANRVTGDQPIPERRTEIEPIVEVLRLDEHIGVEQIGHHTATPRLRPSS